VKDDAAIAGWLLMTIMSDMPARIDIGLRSMGWRCDTCGTLITSIEDGRVEWLAGQDKHGGTTLKGLRLVHRLAASSAWHEPQVCRYDSRYEFRNGQNVVEGLPLERFVGPDGLMLLLSFIAAGDMATNEVIELAKRVQIPGYEQVTKLFPEALAEGLVTPSIGEEYYLQSEIQSLLRRSGREMRSSAKRAL
jgi:hypothetical protein